MNDELINIRNVYYFLSKQTKLINKTLSFDKCSKEQIFNLNFKVNNLQFYDTIRFKSISLYDPETATTLIKFDDVIITSSCNNTNLSNKSKDLNTEINKIVMNLEIWKKIELIIHVNETIEAFKFLELTKNRQTVTFSNLSFIELKTSYLNRFPDEVRLWDYELTFIQQIFTFVDDDFSKVEVKLKDDFIKSIGKRKDYKINDLFSLLEESNIPKLQFINFNSSLGWGLGRDESVYGLRLKATESLKELNFKLFVEYNLQNVEKRKAVKFIFKATDNTQESDVGIISQKIVFNGSPTYKIFKIVEMANRLKVILRRPKGDINNVSTKNEVCLIIKCLSWSVLRRPMKFKLKAVEVIKENFIETILILKQPKEKIQGGYVLYNTLKENKGFLEIKIHEEKKDIGTYGIWLPKKDEYLAVYSNQLKSIPLPPCQFIKTYDSKSIPKKTKYTSKKTIIFFIILLGSIVIIRGVLGVVAHYYLKK